jgi:hypothetical protein
MALVLAEKKKGRRAPCTVNDTVAVLPLVVPSFAAYVKLSAPEQSSAGAYVKR